MSASGDIHPAAHLDPAAHLQQRVAVIGGGIIGLSTAWRLAQCGFAVTVYDRSSPGGEASWAGAGMLAPGGEVEDDSPLATAALTSRRMYPEFVAELERASGCTIDYQECGALELAYTDSEWQELEHRAAAQKQLGISSKPIEQPSVHAFWPRVRTDSLKGARFYPGDAIVNPRDVVSALLTAMSGLRVTIAERCPVLEVAVNESSVEVRTVAGSGMAYCAAVLAAGAWSAEIRVAGVPALPFSEPVKGHLLGYLQPEQTCTTIIRRGRTYLLQRSNGMLLAGASVEMVGFDRQVKPDIVAELASDAGAILPHLNETTPTESWIGFRPSSDGLHVGPWHSERFFLAYGHYRNGILLAPWTAALLRDAIGSSLGTP